MDEEQRAERDALAQGIRIAVRRSAMTQTELSRRIGVSTESIRRWSAGATVPSDENLTKLAKASGLTERSIRAGGTDHTITREAS